MPQFRPNCPARNARLQGRNAEQRRIFHPPQVQARSRRRDAGVAAVARRQHLRAIAARRIGLRLHVEQGADDVAHHVVQIGIGHDFQPHDSRPRAHCDAIRRAAPASSIGTRPSEMPRNRVRRSAPGRRRAWPPHPAGDGSRPHACAAGPSARCDSRCSSGRCAGWPGGGHESPAATSPAHCRAMLGGSLVLAPSTQARGVRSGLRVEMNDLADGVHAGIGAAGANGDDGLAGDERQGRLHGVLDRRRMHLRLPAGIFGAVVLDDGGDAPAESVTSPGQRSRSGATLPVSGWQNLR